VNDRQNKLLLECYRSGQVSEAQWVQHLKDDPELAAYVAEVEKGVDRARRND
jgi:hypothetical protein